jgi:hypothetical protein
MKRLKITVYRLQVIMIIAAAMVMLVACNKERQCKCVYTDVEEDNTLRFIYVDGGMKCESITELAVEKHITDSTSTPPTHSLTRVDIHKVSCREYGSK